MIAVALIVLIFIGTGVYCYACLTRFGKNSATVQTQKVQSGGIVNILLTGTDLSEKRTDTILIVSYNPTKGTLKMVSVPRDTLVTINGKRAKINAANVYGGENLLVTTVENLLDIDINYYASINYTGFDKIIDAIGGVDITIPYNMNYDDSAQNLHIHFTKGTTEHLDGKEAEEFFRWRKNNDWTGLSTGDLGRIDNQHLLLESIMAKVKSPVGLLRVPSLLNAASKYITTNMQSGDIIKYGLTISKIDKSKIEMSTLQGSTPYIVGVSYFVYNEGKNSTLVSALRNQTVQSNTGTSKVEILNCSKKTGLAAKYKTKLEKLGFTDIHIGNGTTRTKSKIILNGVNSSTASILNREFNIDNVVKNKSTNAKYDIVIFLGRDFAR